MTVHLIRGDDPSLVGAAVSDVVHRLVGDADRGLMVEELDGEDYELGALVDAARTPPFLTDRRVVVGRGLRRFFPRSSRASESADDDADDEEPEAPAKGTLAPLLSYLGDAVDTTDLVLEAGGGATPRPLLDAVKKAGGTVVETTIKSTKDRASFFDEHLSAARVRLDPSARQAIGNHLGEDLARLEPLIDVLEATFGEGARLSAVEVKPFLGEAGGVPPWDLTDAIDAGDTGRALELVTRMLGAGERHPLQIMAILHGHYVRLLRLDGANARGESDAADLLKVAPFQAKKALQQGRRLGHDGVARAIKLLAQADLDLRGERDLPEDLVMEVLVARLSRLGPPSRPRR
jgi:DNA polymerase III subunit delta